MRKHALNFAAFIWGVAEATLLFIIPDVLLSYIGVKRGPQAAKFASLYAAVGAASGGVIMYLWSASDFDTARAIVERVPAISDSMIGTAAWNMGGNWIVATFLGPLSATPYKVFAIVAPHEGAPLLAFALASVLARLPRFLVISIGVSLIGRALSRWLSERQLLWVLIGAWLLFYAVFFALMPN